MIFSQLGKTSSSRVHQKKFVLTATLSDYMFFRINAFLIILYVNILILMGHVPYETICSYL